MDHLQKVILLNLDVQMERLMLEKNVQPATMVNGPISVDHVYKGENNHFLLLCKQNSDIFNTVVYMYIICFQPNPATLLVLAMPQ